MNLRSQEDESGSVKSLLDHYSYESAAQQEEFRGLRSISQSPRSTAPTVANLTNRRRLFRLEAEKLAGDAAIEQVDPLRYA